MPPTRRLALLPRGGDEIEDSRIAQRGRLLQRKNRAISLRSTFTSLAGFAIYCHDTIDT